MKKILCYGDSNTWGYVPGTGERYPEDVRWPCVCQKELGEEFKIIEDGINGRTTCYDQGWGDCKNGRTGLGYALLSSYPLDGVVVMLGSNDLSIHDARHAKKGIDELVRLITNANSYFRTETPIFPEGVKILVVAPTLVGDGAAKDPTSLFREGPAESRKFSGYYRDVAQRYGTDYLDAARYGEVSDIDNMHLTVHGHEALGRAIAAKLKKMFE